MARPLKEGIDYFPLDVNMDDNVKLFQAEFGLAGFGFLIKLYQKIYSNGYYINWNDDVCLLVSQEIIVNIKQINDYINCCFRRQLFDKCLYEKYGILTSRGVQKRYIEATQRRTEVNFIQEFLLIEDAVNAYKNDIIVNINSINANKNKVNVNTSIFPPDPLLKTKVYNNKLNKRESKKTASEKPKKEFIPPTFEEVKQYAEKRGFPQVAEKFYDFYTCDDENQWVDSNGKPVRNWKGKFVSVWEKDTPNNFQTIQTQKKASVVERFMNL